MAKDNTITLPPPLLKGEYSLEETLHKRRSEREYSPEVLTLNEISQLLWAAQGISSSDGMRTAPSAGALYPMEIYLLAGNIEGLKQGVYHYSPKDHSIRLVRDGNYKNDLARAALDQDCIKSGSAVIIIAAVYERTTMKYKDRGIRYVHMESGHIAQNIYLQAESLNLGTVFVGAFYDKQVQNVLHIPEEPLGIMPVGKIREPK